MKKQTGIWLDLRDAYIINLTADLPASEGVEVIRLTSDIEERAGEGGTRSKTPWGPQGGNIQRHAQERRHHEEDEYFSRIMKAIPLNTKELVIFGPSEAKHGLAKAIAGVHNQPEIEGVENADQMTQNQMVAWVREFFRCPAPRQLPEE